MTGPDAAAATMRAWRIREKGHPATALAWEDVALPEPGPGQARIRVLAATVNFADILLCQGIYQDRPATPFTPGLEAAGIVEAAGPGVGLPLGARVAAMAALPAGGFAEHALVRAETALVFPAEVPFAEATVLYSTYQTAHVALHHRGRLRAGDWLLVLGGAGGVGSAAIQLGLAAGARVLATAGSPEKVDFCRRLGADEVLDPATPDLPGQVAAITGGHGVDLVFDPVGGALTGQARRCLAWEGRHLVIGFAGGAVPDFPANHALVKNYDIVGVHWSTYPARHRAVVEDAHAAILRLHGEGKVRPVLAQALGLAELKQALAALADRRVIGRLVVTASTDGPASPERTAHAS